MKAYVIDTSVVYKSLSLESGREKAVELFDSALCANVDETPTLW